MIPWIGIALGDITGIGPEVTLKALASELESDDARFALIGDVEQTHELNRQLGLNLTLHPDRGKAEPGRIFLSNPATQPLARNLSPGSPVAARSAEACRDLGLLRARIGVCGLNPHAGEGGQMGTEEQTTIAPAVSEMQRRGMDVVGPMSADALFYYAYRGDYDVVVAMYHDQGLAP